MSGIRSNEPEIGGGTDGASLKSRRKRRLLVGTALLAGLLLVGLTALAIWEMRTSHFQARFLVPIASEVAWWVEEGPADALLPAPDGPHDRRLGYTDLPERVASAEARGFKVVEQARVSPRLSSLVRNHGLFPIYEVKNQAGLTIEDRDSELLFDHSLPERVYEDFEAIPPILWQSLLYIENRTALDPSQPLRNPAVEWGRLIRSTAELGLRYVGRDGNVAGASTLATQMEKFRHSPEGLTSTPREKLLQMGSAAIRAYMDGPETMGARQRVVQEYLNSVPLAAIRTEGEINGIGDGLWAWFGADFTEVNRALHAIPAHRVGVIPAPEELPGWSGADRRVATRNAEEAESLTDRAGVGGALPDEAALHYRQALSLILSQRRPSYFLTTTEGREALHQLTDRYLNILEADGVIDAELADPARALRPDVRVIPPARSPVSFVERKAVNTVRTGLLTLLGVPRLYDLDRTDLSVRSTIDGDLQGRATTLLGNMYDPEFIRERGFDGFRLLDRGDPGEVIYSIALHERTPQGNLVRLQVDNLDAPFNLNESARLELGSTAKLRTLASYLEVVADLHEHFSELSPDSLRRHRIASQDRLSVWTRDRVLQRPGESRIEILQAAMNRGYSANPAERFVTGGGVQSFTNFDNTYDQQVLTATEGFRHSVNLVFVRMMRDVVNHYMYRVPGSTAHVLDERDSPLRQEYLARFADREGIQFMNQFIPRYRGQDRAGILEALFSGRRLSPQRMAWTYRSAIPDDTVEEFARVLRGNLPEDQFSDPVVEDLYRRADITPHSLADQGYLASVHPLELWVARFFVENPDATGGDAIRASEEARQDVYQWLFRTSRTHAQDQRIRSLLEVEAFTEIHKGWQRLGYPFANIVPSLGTSIGSSGDRPAALNELVGIILNEGRRLPTYRVDELHFAPGTPWETRLERSEVAGTQVMDPAVATVLREAMVDVVELGTARRARGIVRDPAGLPVAIGGKTGTGDNRYRVFGTGGRLLESRSVNRTSTFVFFIGDRYYGVVSAYVPGEQADRYHFTSALPTQMLRELGPAIEALIAEEFGPDDASDPGPGPPPQQE